MRTMIFVDHMNFYLSAQNYYSNRMHTYLPTFDYQKLMTEINKRLPFESELMKTQVFFPYSEEPLDAIEPYRSSNNWLSILKSKPFLDIIEGRNQIRKHVDFDISNPNSYTVDEKGTDVNIAVQVLTKAFHNAYDCAVIVSGDSDYVPILDVLRTIGKLAVIVCMEGQSLNRKLIEAADHIIFMNADMISNTVINKHQGDS